MNMQRMPMFHVRTNRPEVRQRFPRSRPVRVSDGKPYRTTDSKFLESLPDCIVDLGAEIMRRVRPIVGGYFMYHPISGKYVQGPDNFWIIKPQHEDRSFRIVVRGLPDRFFFIDGLEIKSDSPSYSTFKITDRSQIDSLIKVLKKAKRRD